MIYQPFFMIQTIIQLKRKRLLLDHKGLRIYQPQQLYWWNLYLVCSFLTFVHVHNLNMTKQALRSINL